MIGGIAAAAVVLAIVGFLVGSSGGGGEEQPEGTSSAQSGAITITYPSSWQRTDDAPKIPGVEFTNPITAGPPNQPNNRLVTGMVDASGPTLLPAAFVKTLGAEPERTDTVRLGDLQAYRYRNLDPGGFTPALTLYAVPTDKGVATVACTADQAQAAQFLPACERAASTLELEGAEPFDLGLGRDYVNRLNNTLHASRRPATPGSRLLKAPRPRSSRRAPAPVARAYARAARSLSRAHVSPQAASSNDALVAALNDCADAWGDLCGRPLRAPTAALPRARARGQEGRGRGRQGARRRSAA